MADYEQHLYRSVLADRACVALAEPEPEGPSDEDVEAAAQRIYEAMRFERVEATPVWSENGNSFAQDAAREAARAVLARWGRPAPQPADSEVAELVAWLRLTADEQPHTSGQGCIRLARAADLLERLILPQPNMEDVP